MGAWMGAHAPPEAGEVIQLDTYDAGKMVEEMREAAFKLKLYASIIYSTNPRKQEAIERINKCADDIIESLEALNP